MSRPKQQRATLPGERNFSRRNILLAVSLPLVVVLLIFMGLMGKFGQSTWNLYSAIYSDLPGRLNNRLRSEVYGLAAQREGEKVRSGAILPGAEDLLLQGQNLKSVEIYYSLGRERYRWQDGLPQTLETVDVRTRGAGPNEFDKNAVDLNGAMRTAKLYSPMPRLFWLSGMKVFVPVGAPDDPRLAETEGGEPIHALMVLHIEARETRVFMTQLAALGLFFYVLLGAIMTLLTRNALIRTSAQALSEQRRKDLNLLQQITQTLSRTSPEDYDYMNILGEIKAGLEADVVGLYVRDRYKPHLFSLRHLTGFDEDLARHAPDDPLGEAWIEQLIPNHGPVHIEDIQANTNSCKSFLAQADFKSFTWFPMRTSTELFGGIFTATQASGGHTEQQCYIIEVIASELLLIFLGEELRTESLHRQQRFETLGRLSEAISANTALDDVLQMVLNESTRGTEAFKGFIAVQGEQSGSFRIFSSTGFGPVSQSELGKPATNTFFAQVLDSSEPIMRSRMMDIALPPEMIEREGLHSVLAAPIVSHRERAIGALAVFNRQYGVFDAAERITLEALANQAAIAYDQCTILEAHREQTRLYEAILERAHDMIFFLDKEGRFTYANQAWPAMLNLSDTELKGQELFKYCHSGDLIWFRRDLEEVLGGRGVQAANVRLRDREGRWHFVEANLSPIYGHGDETRGIFGIARDMTEVRLTDLRQKRLLGARQVIADLKIGMPLPDILATATSEIGRLFGVDWVAIVLGENDIEDGYGWRAPEDVYEPGAVLGPPMRGWIYRRVIEERFSISGDLMSDFYAQAPPDDIDRTRRRTLPLSFEAAAITSAGGEDHGVLLLFHESTGFFHGWDEIPMRTLGSELGNLFSQKFLESQILIQNQVLAARTRRATEMTQLKSRFLAAISHELRTPLHAIIGFTEVVMEKTPDLPPRRMRNLDAVLRNARMLLSLIEELLDLTRIEAGKVKIKPEQFNVPDLIEEVAQSLRGLAEAKTLRLRVDTLHSEGQAFTDRGKIRQILVNLVSNAIKYTDEGEIAIGAMIDSAHMIISVKDTGIGISEDSLGAIFQEFERINTPQTQNRRGVGLGLALSQRLASILGGSIHVKTTSGEGSTFTLDIPLRYEVAQRAEDDMIGPLFERDADEVLPDFSLGDTNSTSFTPPNGTGD